MKYTVIGGNGFIGKEIVDQLSKSGDTVWIPKKNDNRLFSTELGTVIYCAGHGDCQTGYFKVLHSNTILLSEIVEQASFERLVYISSTRVYMGQEHSKEGSDLSILVKDSRKLFNLTKLVSEEILLKSKKNVCIVRPSNVYGVALTSSLFLPSIVRNAINNGKVDMFVSKNYAKDYVSVDDVARMTIAIAKDKTVNNQIFNIASGRNTTAMEIAEILMDETNCLINWHENTTDEIFPVTSIEKLHTKYEFKPERIEDNLVQMIDEYKSNINNV